MKRNFFKIFIVFILLFIVLACPEVPNTSDDDNPADATPSDKPVLPPKHVGPVSFDPQTIVARDQIVSNCSVIGGKYSYSRVIAKQDYLVPLVWASVEGYSDDAEGVTGSLPTLAWIGLYHKGKVAVWSGHDGYFSSEIDGTHDNDRFRKQFLDWLAEGKSKLAFTTGHGEMTKLINFSNVLKTHLAGRPISLTELAGNLSLEALLDYDVLIIGNPWGSFSEEEVLNLKAWVADGGSLLVTGLGWSWHAYNPEKVSSEYAVNQIGSVFGWEAKSGGIKDFELAAKHNEGSGVSVFEIEPLEHYHPVEVKIYDINDASANQKIKIAEKGIVKGLKGQYGGLYLFADPNGVNYWAQLNNPIEAVKRMDKAIEEQMKLAGNRFPFKEGPIWYSYVVDTDGAKAPFYMYSGNPVIFKMAAGVEMVKYFNQANKMFWGIVHENGHNMVARLCGDHVVLSGGGTGEVWANVFTILAYDASGWSFSDDITDPYGPGEAYHANPSAVVKGKSGMEYLKDDAWVLLGCLNLIIEKHGKTGMKDFLKNLADDYASGTRVTGDIDRMDYTVLKMSQAYGKNFVSLFQHWGYSVKGTTISALSSLPEHEVIIN